MPEDRKIVEDRAARCEVRSVGVGPKSLADAAARIANVAGAAPDRRPSSDAQPTLSMDAGSAAFAAVTWDPAGHQPLHPRGLARRPWGTC